MDARLLFDIFSAIVLFAVAVLGSWLPLHLSQGAKAHHKQGSNNSKTLYHIGNCLSAGVMLSAGFCHLLADSLKELAFVGRFPMANFLAAVGFLVTLAADQVVQHISEATGIEEHHHHHRSEQQGSGLEMSVTRQKRVEKQPLLASIGEEHGSETAAVHRANGNGNGSHPSAPLHILVEGSGSNGQHGRQQEISRRGDPGSDDEEWAGEGGGPRASEDGAGHLDVLLSPALRKLSFATAVLLASALCVHSVLEGMALGAQQSMRSTQDIMLAIAAHKGLAAYALGASVVESGADTRRFWTVTLTFSAATPVAIFIGYGLSTVSDGKGGSALSALASGTFLYVAMMEVIPRELSSLTVSTGPRWMRGAKMAALIGGFGAMSLLAIWA